MGTMLQANEGQTNDDEIFSTIEADGDVTTLLNEIRTIGLQIETNASVYDALDEDQKMHYAYCQVSLTSRWTTR